MSAEGFSYNERIRSGEQREPEFGPIRLVVGLRSVTSEGRSVQLAPIEYQMLWMMVRAQGDCISDSQIRDFIYDDPDTDAPLSDSITPRITSLRKKLGSITSDVVIEHERGFGYKLTLKSN